MNELLRLAALLTATTGLLMACCLVPLAPTRYGHPFLGVLASLFAIRLWTWAVRPMPGFFQGTVSIAGLGVIIGVFAACLVRVVV
jgi:hypothetical protein